MTNSDDAPSARPSTHAWCLICRSVRPTVDKPLADTSPKRKAGLEGATLHCAGCDTNLLTIYTPVDEANRHVVASAAALS